MSRIKVTEELSTPYFKKLNLVWRMGQPCPSTLITTNPDSRAAIYNESHAWIIPVRNCAEAKLVLEKFGVIPIMK